MPSVLQSTLQHSLQRGLADSPERLRCTKTILIQLLRVAAVATDLAITA